MKYCEWVKQEAQKVGSDGCTFVSEIHEQCCFEHDLGYYYGRDPRDAFKFDSWEVAIKIERGEVDKRFRQCNQKMDVMGKASPMAWWRWVGVRVGGKALWAKHRKARP